MELRLARWFMRPWNALFVDDICPCEFDVVLAVFDEDATPYIGLTSLRLSERMPVVPCDVGPTSR